MTTFTWVGGLPGPYNMSSAFNWTPSGVPGASDVALLQNSGSTGPYTLNGSLTLGELLVISDIAILKGSISTSGSFSNDMLISTGGQFTVASTGTFSGSDIISVGTNLSAGQLTVDGLLNTGQVDVFNQGTLAVGSTGTLNGDIFIAGGTLTVAPGLTLSNAIHIDGNTGATLETSGAVTVNSVIDEVAGHGSLVVNGGTVVLNGTNTFSGGATLASGVLSVDSLAIGSGPLSIANGMLLATSSETFSGNVLDLGPTSTLAAAPGQTLVITNNPTSTDNVLGGTIFIGAPGASGAVQLNLGNSFYNSPTFTVQAGTLLESPTKSGLIAGWPLTIETGATLDLAGGADRSSALAGGGVLTNSGTASQFLFDGGSFAGTITGAVELHAQNSPTLSGTIAASALGSIDTGWSLNLVTGALIASSMADDGSLQSTGTDTIAGPISGTGSIVVNGGSLTLIGSNSFNGGVTVLAGGTLTASPNAIGNPGSSILTITNGMLLATTSETIPTAINLNGTATLAAAHGQNLIINSQAVTPGDFFGGTIYIGAPGADGTVRVQIGSAGFNSPDYIIQAGTMLDSSLFLGGAPISIAAGATLDLDGAFDMTDTLTGNGVLTNSGTTAPFFIYGGFFFGTIEGPVLTTFENPTFLSGTFAATTPGTINTLANLELGFDALVASPLVDNGLLTGEANFSTATIAANITGTGTLLQGASNGTLLITGTADVTGGNTASGGILQIGNGGTTGTIVGNITDNAELVFDRSDSIDFTGTIGGIGYVVQQGTGTLTLTATNTFSEGLLLTAGVVELATSVAGGSGTIAFVDPATLRLDSIKFSNTIDSFGAGETIDLAALPFTASPTFAYNGAVLDVISNGTTVVLNLPGTLTTQMFGAKDDGHGGTAVIACFASGTRIATPRRAIAVERLREGDEVITVTGRHAPIKWIGRRRVDCRRHPNRERVWPVRIAPHAFGDGRPQRALLLSPDHSVFTEGVLIPIRFLINDTTVTQIEPDRITYYHIELDQHDVVLAEGLPAETFLDTGERYAFENSDVTQLHPDFAPDEAVVAEIWQTQGYAPLLGTNGEFDRAQRMLACQAIMLARRPANAEQQGPHPHHPHRQPAASRGADRVLHPPRARRSDRSGRA
jgi:autotransporter-associated beta strand protein